MKLAEVFAPLQLLLSSSPAPPNPMGSLQQHAGKVFTPTNYSVVPGFFVQDSPDFNATGYDLLQDSFGLLDKSPSRWSTFRSAIARLNAGADEHTTYKVIYIARHGQGWHNVAEAKYGTPEWNRRWSRLEGDGEMVWGPDPLLTPLGVKQALAVNSAWKEQLEDGVPLPQRLYSSPLSRSAATLNLTWSDILIDTKEKGVTPLIREHLRETIGLHTCDRRSTKSVIAKRFHSFRFEVPFSEHDQLWSPTYQESTSQQALRIQQLLNHLFATDSSSFVSLTAHGGVIDAFFRVVGHRMHAVPPGGFVPVVVKAVWDGEREGGNWAGGRSREAGPVPTAVAGRQSVEL